MSYVHDRSTRHFPTVVAAREGSTCDILRLQSGEFGGQLLRRS